MGKREVQQALELLEVPIDTLGTTTPPPPPTLSDLSYRANAQLVLGTTSSEFLLTSERIKHKILFYQGYGT